jgi:hypothetical protein
MITTHTVEVTSGTFEAHFGNIPLKFVERWTNDLMVALDGHSEAIGPMVVADTSTGELVVSFEFAAVGDVDQDVPKAMRILREAIEATVSESAIDVLGTPTEGWASQPGPRQVDLVYA